MKHALTKVEVGLVWLSNSQGHIKVWFSLAEQQPGSYRGLV